MWAAGDVTLLPSTIVYEVVDILDLLDASEKITDLELLGGFKIEQFKRDNWAVTVTVNNLEPVGSITCFFYENNAHNVDLNLFD